MIRALLAPLASIAAALTLGAPAAFAIPAHGGNCPYGANAGDACAGFTYYDPNAYGGRPGVPGVGGGDFTITPNTRTGAYIVSQEFPKYGSKSWQEFATSMKTGVGSDQTWASPHPQPFALMCIDVHCGYDTTVPLQDPTDNNGTGRLDPSKQATTPGSTVADSGAHTGGGVSGLPLKYPPVIAFGGLKNGCAQTSTQVSNLTQTIITCTNPQGGGPLDISHWEFGVNPNTQTGVNYQYGVGNPAHDPTRGCVIILISPRTTVPVLFHDNDLEYGPGCTRGGQVHIQSLNGTNTLNADTWYYGQVTVGSSVFLTLDQSNGLGVIANTADSLGSLAGCSGSPCTGHGHAGKYQFAPLKSSCAANTGTRGLCNVNGGSAVTFAGSWDTSGVLTVTPGSVRGGSLAVGDTFNCLSPPRAGTCTIVFDRTSRGTPCNGAACTGASDGTDGAGHGGTYSISVSLNLTKDVYGPSWRAQPAFIQPCSTCGASGNFSDQGGAHSIWFWNNVVDGHSENGDTTCGGWPCEGGGTNFSTQSGVRVIAYNVFKNQGQRPINGGGLGSVDNATGWVSSSHRVGNFFFGMGTRPFGVHAEMDEFDPFQVSVNVNLTAGSPIMQVTKVRSGHIEPGMHVGFDSARTPKGVPAGTTIVSADPGGLLGNYTMSQNATQTVSETISLPGILHGPEEYLYNICLIPNYQPISSATSCIYNSTGRTDRFVWTSFNIEGNTLIANTKKAGCDTGFYTSDGWSCPAGGPIVSRLTSWGQNTYLNMRILKNYMDDNVTGPYAGTARGKTDHSLNGGSCFDGVRFFATFPKVPYWGSDATGDANVALTTGLHIPVTPTDGHDGFGPQGWGPKCH